MKSGWPLPVLVIACLYLATGAVGLFYHLSGLRENPAEVAGIEAVRLLAVVSGVFMLRAQNWARWLALAWMAFHVVIGALHSVAQFAVHLFFLAVIAYLLFRPSVNRYFNAGTRQPPVTNLP